MSKERELLKKLVRWCWQTGTVPTVLQGEIEELFAQPEQPTREPLSDGVVRKFADAEYMVCNNAFTQGVRWAEQQHKIGVEQ